MYTVATLREKLDDLVGGLNLMLKFGPERYCHRNWHAPCGTMHCTGGWIEVAGGREIDFDESFLGDPWDTYLFLWESPVDAMFDNVDLTCRFGYMEHDGSWETAIRRLKRVIKHLRRRLAILEVEEGRRWHEVPTGQARTQLLEEFAQN